MSEKEFEEPAVEADLMDVEEAEAEAEVEIEPVVAEAPKPRGKPIVIPIAVDINKVYDALPEPAGPAVVGMGEVDDVHLNSCIFKNVKSRKSLTVHHMQRRLVELGYAEADLDPDGYFGDTTLMAITRFQSDNSKLERTGSLDEATFKAIFKGDPNVRVNV
jgi:peptidoglycan hydrolase-like protein with peptidoglycan-binding domain